jgi:hypothetical protein
MFTWKSVAISAIVAVAFLTTVLFFQDTGRADSPTVAAGSQVSPRERLLRQAYNFGFATGSAAPNVDCGSEFQWAIDAGRFPETPDVASAFFGGCNEGIEDRFSTR